MRVVHTLPSVNQRRYGKVWIAKVTEWGIGKPPVLDFGGAVDYDTAEIDAAPADLLKAGRKDHRGSNSDNDFFIVQSDLTLSKVGPVEAKNYWLEQRK